MDFIEPIIFFDKHYQGVPATSETPSASMAEEKKANKEPAIDMNKEYKLNLNYFMSDDAKIDGTSTPSTIEEKKSTPKRRSANIIKSESKQEQMTDSTKVPYVESFNEPMAINRSIVTQADELAGEMKLEFDTLHASKSVKGKYTYLTNMASAISSLLATKRAAASDIAKSINDAHNLELKRAKDLKEFDQNKQNDDAHMMDMYSAFIRAPMGMYDNALNMPTMTQAMLSRNDPNNPANIQAISMTGQPVTQGISPEQYRMRMEGNSNIEEVVVFEPATGRRWFEAIDRATGQSVPNYPVSDPFLLEDTSIELRAGIAKNRNLDKVWNLKVLGDANMSEY